MANCSGLPTCEQIDEDWIEAFREWAIEVPIVTPTGVHKERSLGTVEASVRQLAAVINFAHDRKDTMFPAAFSAKSPDAVSRTPTYRASIETLGAMFAYATKRDTKGKSMAGRAALLRFLQLSVATWARPDAVHDVSTDKARQQWISGFEPLTPAFGGQCSIQLSYRCLATPLASVPTLG